MRRERGEGVCSVGLVGSGRICGRVDLGARGCCGDGEGRDYRVGEVVLLGVFAVEVCAFDVEEAAVEELEGASWVPGSL